ncbi:MAG: response regulator [Thermodesulfobacteriota bacterium]
MNQTGDSPISKGKILITDDDPGALKVLAMQVEHLGYQTAKASSGEEALQLLEEQPFDLLLTDLLMPGMDGISLLGRAKKAHPDLECIVISGQGEVATAVEAMRAGAANYIEKPVSMSELDISLVKGMERVALLRDLARQQQEINLYHQQLEMLVAERTSELACANQQLKQDLLARQKAEQEAEHHRQQLIEADKMVSLGILVAGVAHEINNPNNFISLNAPLLQQAWTDVVPILEARQREEGDFLVAGIPFSEMRHHLHELLAGIVAGSERIRRIVVNLRDYARQGVSEMDQRFDLNEVVNAALLLLTNPIKQATSNLRVGHGQGLPLVKGNFQRVEQVVVNLLQNACQSLSSRDQAISITTGCVREPAMVFVEVSDQGTGIPPENLQRVQDPFFTTKRNSGGTGLGLSISAGIMEEHNGRLDFRSEPGKGTTVRASFPISLP